MAVPCSPVGDKQVQLRRGTTAENNAFTGADGELSFDTDQNRLRVHDDVTPGGYPIAGTSIENIFTANQAFTGNVNFGGSASMSNIGTLVLPILDVESQLTVETQVGAEGNVEFQIFNTDTSSPTFELFGNGRIGFPDGIRQTFNPNATVAGLNVGSFAGDPSTPINGDLWYNSATNELTARINGVNVDLGAGSAPPFSDSTALVMGSADPTKLLRFEVDGFTAGVTRVLTPQDASYIIAGTNIVNVFTVNQAFNDDLGISIGSMLLTDPSSAGQLVIANGSVSIPDAALTVGPASEIILSADGAASFASGVSFFTNTGQLFVGPDTTLVPDGSAYFGAGQVLQIFADGSVHLNANIDLNADGSAAFGAAGVFTISTAGLLGFPDDLRQIFNPGATVAGLNVGALAGDPSTPINGDLWYDSTANELTARINGVNVALGTGGYTLTFGTLATLIPVDSTTYYFTFTGDPAATSTTYNNVKVAVPKTGILRRFDMLVRVGGTLGSAETVSHFVRINDATDVGQIDCAYDVAAQNVSSTINQAVTAGDFVAIKLVAPAWATNPTTIRHVVTLYIE